MSCNSLESLWALTRDISGRLEGGVRCPWFPETRFLQFLLSDLEVNGRQHAVVRVRAFRVADHLDVFEHALPCSVACAVCAASCRCRPGPLGSNQSDAQAREPGASDMRGSKKSMLPKSARAALTSVASGSGASGAASSAPNMVSAASTFTRRSARGGRGERIGAFDRAHVSPFPLALRPRHSRPYRPAAQEDRHSWRLRVADPHWTWRWLQSGCGGLYRIGHVSNGPNMSQKHHRLPRICKRVLHI